MFETGRFSEREKATLEKYFQMYVRRIEQQVKEKGKKKGWFGF